MTSDLPGLRRRMPAPQSEGRGFPAIRLLPVVIFAAVCMLGLRIEVVVKTIAHARRTTLQVSPQIAAAQAQTPQQSAAAPAGQPPAAPAADDKSAGDEEASKTGGDAATTGGSPAFNAANLTPTEIKTLQRLSERREQIEKREQEVAAREAVLKAGEDRIDGKVVQLQDLEKSIKGLLAQYDKQKQAEIDNLVKIYSTMKPKDAAKIFNDLDMPILVAVTSTMATAKVAPIMAVMDTNKARLLTEELSQKKQFNPAGG